jgi:hypothetical protein
LLVESLVMSGSCVAIAFADGFADWESFDVFVAIEETLLVESLVGLSCQLSGDQGEFN